MKNKYIKTLAILPAFAMLASCSENAWNDKYLDGFEVPPVYEDIQEINYTLTSSDYESIAKSSVNMALATTEEEKEALAAIGINHYFANSDEAHKYIPALLSMSSFQYFTLDNGSTVLVTYNLPTAGNSTVAAINANTPEYKVTEEEYMEAWGSEDDYINGFAPMLPASSVLPGILAKAYPDAENGQYVVVNYNEATTNPIFGTVSGGDSEEETPGEFEMTDVLANVSVGESVNIKGIVTGINGAGFVVTDKGGSIFYYQKDFNDDSLTIGSEVEVTGEIGQYNRGLQVSVNQNYTVVGTTTYTYPAPTVYDGAMIEAACKSTDDIQAPFVTVTGTASVGNYINIIIEGTECQASPYNAPDYIKSQIVDGEEITLTGYFIYVASSKYFYILVTSVNDNATRAAYSTRGAVGTVETVSKNAIYMYDEGEWVIPANTVVLQPSDYTDMNQSYGNLSNDLPATLLPVYLDKNYPYASEDDVMIVVYKYYVSGEGTTYQCSQFVNDGAAWTGWIDENFGTDRFNKTNDSWMWNPSVAITLPYERNNVTSVTFYQACCDWVYANIDVPYYGSTDITDGKGFVTTYGNNEYYTGASAYYCNVDLRPAKAVEQCATGFGDFPGYGEMTDDEIVYAMKQHFDLEVAPAVLGNLYPDATPIEGVEVTYSVTFTTYTNTGSEEVTGVWNLVGKGQFEFAESSWY